ALVVDLDGRLLAADRRGTHHLGLAAARGRFAAAEELNARLRGAHLSIRGEFLDDFTGPIGDLATIWIAAAVEVNAAKTIIGREDVADTIQPIALHVAGDRTIEVRPRCRIVALGSLAGGLIWDLRRLVVTILDSPGHPLPTRAKRLRNFVKRHQAAPFGMKPRCGSYVPVLISSSVSGRGRVALPLFEPAPLLLRSHVRMAARQSLIGLFPTFQPTEV